MATPNSFSVDLIGVNGSYESRRNPAEAQRIAEEAIRFMRRFADMPEKTIPTLGIVAINREQRDLLAEELRRLEAGDTLVEVYREKVAAKGEQVFVKNLENVQGDERDFILVSMTYGPKSGRTEVLQRFGPINSKQGHRRLNVLFTRARIRLAIYTSMDSDDIKPVETSSDGVRVLKRYFEYAESRGRASVESLGDSTDSDFEAEVADRLRMRGFHIDTQVGVSGFKIDLGVRHPDRPDQFIVGIECDGAAYHSSKSARDRDRLREDVLKGLGWEILRVWSTDWFDNADLQTDRLVQQIEKMRQRPGVPYEVYVFAPAAAPRTSDGGEDHLTGEIELQADVSDEAANDVRFNSAILAEAPANVLAEEALTRPAAGLAEVLREFRDRIVAVETPGWQPHRSILRESMIETLIAQKVRDPNDWFLKIPQFQRAATNPH